MKETTKKAKTLRVTAVVAVIALAIASMLALSVGAAGTTPDIVSANISYEGNHAIVLAIDAATVSGGSVSVQVWDEAGKEVGKYSASATEKIAALGGKDFYVVKTAGIAQKDMDKEFTCQATDAAGNVGNKTKISVAEYFYTRLFVNGIADATEGADLARKNLYLNSLTGGALAQDLFANYNESTEDDVTVFVDDLLYVNVPGYDFAGYATALLDNNTTEVTLPGEGFYTVTKYAKDTLAKTVTESVAAGTEITIDAHTVVTVGEVPVLPFEFGQGKYYADAAVIGDRFDYTEENGLLKLDGAGSDKAELVDGKLVYSRVGTGESYIRWNYTAKPETMTNPVFIYETDFMFDGFTATSITTQKILFQANSIGKQVTPSVASVSDNALERKTWKIGDLELRDGQWYNLRVEIDYTAGTITYVLNNNANYSEALGTGSTTASRILWYYLAAQTAGSMSYDNTFIGWVEAEVEAPFVAGQGAYYNNSDIVGTKFDYASANANIGGVAAGDTADISTGALVFTRGGTADSYIRFDHTGFAGNEGNPVFVFESDFMFSGYKANVEAGGRIGRFDFRANGVYKELHITATAIGADGVITEIKMGDLALKADKWYNIAFVLDYKANKINYLINGEVAATGEIGTGTNSANRAHFYFEAAQTAGVMTFDNTIVACIDTNPPAPVEGGDFYNSDAEGVRMNGDNLLANVREDNGTGNDTLAMADGALAFTKTESGSTFFRWGHNGTPEGLETPVMVFEADMTFDNLSVTTGNPWGTVAWIKLAGNNKEASIEIQYYTDANAGVTSVYLRGANGNAATITGGKAFNVRFEVDCATGDVGFYVDGTLIKTMAAVGYADKEGYNHARIEYSSTAATASITFDNVYIGIVEDGTAN